MKQPDIEAMALDLSPTMLDSARDYFANDSKVTIIVHGLSQSVPDVSYFNEVVSSFAILHLRREHKRVLYEEINDIINPTGVFCNLERIASTSVQLQIRFLDDI